MIFVSDNYDAMAQPGQKNSFIAVIWVMLKIFLQKSTVDPISKIWIISGNFAASIGRMARTLNPTRLPRRIMRAVEEGEVDPGATSAPPRGPLLREKPL